MNFFSKLQKKLSSHFFLQQLLKVPMLIVFLIMVCFFSFKALSLPAEVNRYAIVTAVGIDKAQNSDKYEVSLLLFVPVAEQTFTETYKMISSEGESVAEAMDYAGLHVGREIGLSHIKFIVLNEELLNDDVSLFLDYLCRNIQLSSSTKLIATDSSAKDFLKSAQKLDSDSSIKVSELVTYNKDNLYASDSSLESFFKSTYGPTRVGLITFFRTEQSQGEGISAASSDSGSSQGGKEQGEGSSSAEEIVNNGETMLFKDGRKVMLLDGEKIKDLNLIRGRYSTGSIEISNFSNDQFNDANLAFEIFNKQLKFIVDFENGVPVVYIDTGFVLRLSEVQNKGEVPKQNVELFVLTDDLMDAIEKKVRESVANGLQIMRENKADIADFYTTIYNSNRTAFKNFMDGLDDKDDYLNHIVFKLGIRINAK